MPGSPPTSSTFPSSITCTIVPSPKSDPANVLILLHSIGDTQEGFANLAKSLNLPETVCISLCAPKTLPFGLRGYQWSEDVIFQGQDLSLDAKFEKAGSRTLKTVVAKLMAEGWKSREIFFFGWGQGAICVFDYLCREGTDVPQTTPGSEFGGVVSIGGIVGSEVKTVLTDEANKSNTPVLLCGGRNGLVTKKAEDRVKSLFRDVETVKWDRDGDGMMNDAKEATPVMKYKYHPAVNTIPH
ncbi:hypothetical protein DRE_00462 [Drechslerella stenobrocha 248]|uniref:Phospholipase/carboxylesterase/thioesterase domain-containing protein n=1 Tax=Drechslerella stenobrocha 248 TaxID=1043628 RepID=W7HVG2_9PEZI|nr:hypothetical protein DRE_00462 [Drechslerella stenobrocha 248]